MTMTETNVTRRRDPLPAESVFNARDLSILLLILFVGAIVRFYKLDASLWFDEVLTLTEFVRLSAWEIMTTYTSFNNHVFFTLQAHASVAMFGESAWALRLPAVLFGVAAIPLIWLLVLRTSGSMVMAHVSASLLALNYHHIWFSQNARGYTGLVFWSLLVLLLLIEARRSQNFKLLVGISIAAGLAMFTHLSAAFFLAGLFLAFIAAELWEASEQPFMRRVMPPTLAFVGAGLLALALHAPVIPDILENVLKFAEPKQDTGQVDALAGWKNPLSAFLTALSHLSLPGPVVLIAAPVFGIVSLFAFIRVARWNKLLALSIPLSIVTTIVCLLIAGMRIWPRFFLTDVVLCLVLAVAGVAAIAELVAKDHAAARLKYLGWAFGIAVSAVWATQNFRAPKQDFAGAVAFVQQESEPGDTFASLGLASEPISSYFAPDWASVFDASALQALMRAPGRTWVVYAFPEPTRITFPDAIEVLERDFESVAHFPGTLGGGSVLVWREK